MVALHSGHGAIAQLGERLLCKQEVAGSIPAGSTQEIPANWPVVGLAAEAGRGRDQAEIKHRL
jgi:hypothetical protein